MSKIDSLEDLREAGDPVLLENGEMRFGVKGNSRYHATVHHRCHTRMISLAPKASLESFVWVFTECVVGGLFNCVQCNSWTIDELRSIGKKLESYVFPLQEMFNR